jgi:hypothetical protein
VAHAGQAARFQVEPNLSNPADPGDPSRALAMRASRIHKNLEVANRMEPYARRLRLRLKHFDVSDLKKKQRLANAHREMTKILVKKKMSPDEAHWTVAQTLDIAADHQLEVLRRDQNLQDLSRSQRDLRCLIKQLDRLGLAISKLPPLAKGKLNKIVVAKQDWRNFDTETFSELVQAMTSALSESSPACTSEKVITAINEKIRSGTHPAVTQIVRTAPPALIELWQIIPSETRTQVEASLRNWVPPTRRPAMEFLIRLSTLLKKFQPRLKRGQRSPIELRFGQRVARIWQGLGLHVGRAVSGHSKYRGTFQRFTRFALIAVGDDMRLSNRQVVNLKSNIRRKRNSTSKSLR